MITGSFEPSAAPTDASPAPGTESAGNQAGFAPSGTLIGDKYRVERTLGEGAMGIVLAARHLVLDELVAVKCIRATLPWSPDLIARFAREAKACARLKSEHIAKVIDVGVSPLVGPYMVMEYLEGEDLAAALRLRGPLPARRAAEYVMQVCEALAVAHAASITHRDVKPENLFLTRHGDLEIIKVLDFGISKAKLPGRVFGGELSVTDTQSLMGTPLYMSPEQIRSTREVDHRSDLWSLGVVLFELLTARPAFAGETITQVCAQVLEASTPRLSEHCSSAPPGLAEVIERCLRKDPAERYQSAAELAHALLPFAPARARLHAERATSVLGTTSANLDESLPSTRREGRGAQAQRFETTAPTVLGAETVPRSEGQRLFVLGFFALCLGLGFRALFPARTETQPAASSRDAGRTSQLPGRSEASETGVRRPSTQPADDAAPRSAPAIVTSGAPKRPRAAPHRSPAKPSVSKLAASEAAAPEPAARSVPAVKPRPRLLDEPSPVRLLE